MTFVTQFSRGKVGWNRLPSDLQGAAVRRLSTFRGQSRFSCGGVCESGFKTRGCALVFEAILGDFIEFCQQLGDGDTAHAGGLFESNIATERIPHFLIRQHIEAKTCEY